MHKSTVEKIRVAYASGKYDKLSLLLSYKDLVKGEDIAPILSYEILPEVCASLKNRIAEVPEAQKAYLEYQQALRVEVEKAEAAELSGNKHYPFKERAEVAKEALVAKLQALKTITFEDLRGFYLPDEEAC